jgi:hypothetical protein
MTVRARDNSGYSYTITIDGQDCAEYRYATDATTEYARAKDRRDMCRAVRQHLDNGGTPGNYQW